MRFGLISRLVFAVLVGVLPAKAAGGAIDATPAQTPTGRLRVYLDCNGCFPDYLRTEIKWVDFVRQREEADVHLIGNSEDTGGGGREVTLRFVGVARFQGVDHELRALSAAGDTEDMRRRGVLQAATVGFLGYAARQGLPADLTVSVRAAAAAPAGKDRWNLWVFSMSGASAVDAEETNRQWSWDARTTADRVTDRWKISFGARIEHETERFNLDEDEPLEVTRRERQLNWFAARSLGEHWSVGLDGGLQSSTFGNTTFLARTAPAIEFNVYPYSQYASRQLRLQYAIGPVYARYGEITLFGRLHETLGRHLASLTLDQRQPWGTIEVGAEWSQYLHDGSKYRLEVQSDLALRLARGLSLRVEGSASRVRDQLALPRRNASPEEILLRLRELQSGYEVGLEIGLTYSFGSIFNNIVNPRFGR
jgi:hypothetical protein